MENFYSRDRQKKWKKQCAYVCADFDSLFSSFYHKQTTCSVPAEEPIYSLLTLINEKCYLNLNQRIIHAALKMQTKAGKHTYAERELVRMESSRFLYLKCLWVKYESLMHPWKTRFYENVWERATHKIFWVVFVELNLSDFHCATLLYSSTDIIT